MGRLLLTWYFRFTVTRFIWWFVQLLAAWFSTTASNSESSTPRNAALRMQADRTAQLRFAVSGFVVAADCGKEV
jgi:hypothetical protein